MKKPHFPFLLLIIAMLSSCSSSRNFTNGLTGNDLNNLQMFEPLCSIGIYDKGNQLTRSDSLSEISKELLTKRMLSDPRLDIADTLFFEDSLLNERIQSEIEYMMFYATSRGFKDLKITYSIDSILDARGQRFGLLAYTKGFTRTKGNYAGAIAKGVGLTILSLGSAIVAPYKESTIIYLMIVDAMNDNVAFFNGSPQKEFSPSKDYTYKNQLQEILWKFKK